MSPKPRVDLSGFRARQGEPAEQDEPTPAAAPPPPTVPKLVPPPPADDDVPSPPAGRAGDATGTRRSRRTKPASTPTEGRQRLLVSVPVSVGRAARKAAEDQDVYLSEFVLAAFRDHADGLRKELARPARRGSDSPFAAPARRRRRKVEDPSQLVFTATPMAAAAIDELAEECGLTRSALVTIVLERQLGLVADAS